MNDQEIVKLFCAGLNSQAPFQTFSEMPGRIYVTGDLEEVNNCGCLGDTQTIAPPLALPGDLCIAPDYCCDGMTEDQSNAFSNWYYDLWEAIDSFMVGLGYKQVGEELDGSGNSLYYCATVYRKI